VKKYAIIVAGGKGSRMGGEIPKQFLCANGFPLIMHAVNLFHTFDPNISMILVLPRDQTDRWRELCIAHSFNVPVSLAESGPERFHSVKSGLKLVGSPDALVAVHDAVRPMVSKSVIERVYRDAEKYGSAIPAIPMYESVREKTGPGSKPADRSRLLIVQTPQCFRAGLLMHAYLQSFREEFTDDANVLEHNGGQIHLVEGNPENIKITTKSDLIIAEALLKSGF
jgi:2-C-methyl-D-erythritol 4-phosphate cytidylyltransferase